MKTRDGNGDEEARDWDERMGTEMRDVRPRFPVRRKPEKISRTERTILHLDMDAYFAEVERLSNPYLRGKPVIVGGRPGDRGVVSTATYEARSYGIHSGMPLSQAERLCPHGIFIPCDPSKYVYFSTRILKFMLQITPRTEMWSIDEAFLDVSDKVELREDRFLMSSAVLKWGGAQPGGKGTGAVPTHTPRDMPLERLARDIQEGIEKRFGLSCSIGGGPNKLVAKMATKLQKPRGVTLLDRTSFRRVFWPRPVEDLWGIGAKSGALFFRLGIRTIGDLARADSRKLSAIVGIIAPSLISAAQGREGSPVVSYGEGPPPKSLGHEHTVSIDIAKRDKALGLLLSLTDKVARELRGEGYVGRTVVVKIRTSSFVTFTRQRTLSLPTNENRILYKVVKDLFLKNDPKEPLRLLGVTVSGLSRPGGRFGEEPLFLEDRRYRNLLSTLDRVHEDYGPGIMIRAATMRERPSLSKRESSS